MLSSVATKYARALADVVTDVRAGQEVLAELRRFLDLLRGHKELRETLLNPALPFKAKRNIVERIAPGVPLGRISTNFLLVLLGAARLKNLDAIVEAYDFTLDERQGIVRGTVFSASDLDNQLRRQIEAKLAERSGKRVKIEYVRDESLIGGVRLQVGSTVFDGSIRSQLDQIHARLTSE